MTGEELKRRRERLDWTQVKLAERLDCTKQSVIRYEQMDKIPREIELAFRWIEQEEGK